MASDNTISKSTTPADESGTAHSFLKSFPRELRDQIYNLLSQEREDLIESYHCHAYRFRTRTTLPKVRLLCHQIKEEYDGRPLAGNRLEVTECSSDEIYVRRPPRKIPLLALRTTVLHLDLVCCKDPADSAMKCLANTTLAYGTKRAWVELALHDSYGKYTMVVQLIPQLPLLERVTMRLSCGNMDCAMALQSTDEHWTAISQLSQIELLRNVYDHDLSRDHGERLGEYQLRDHNTSKSPECFRNRETMATWTPAQG